MTKSSNISENVRNTAPQHSHYPLPPEHLDSFMRQQQDFLEVQQFILDRTSKTFSTEKEEVDFAFRVAESFVERQDFPQATHYLIEVSDKYPDNCALYLKMADYLSKMGELDDACATLREATRREPKNVTYWLKAVELFMQASEYKAAHECLEQVFELQPQALKAKRKLAELYSEVEQDEQAERVFEDIASTGLEDPDLDLAKAKLRFRQGKIEEALDLYTARFGVLDNIPDAYPQFSDTALWEGQDINTKILFIAYESNCPNQLLFSSLIQRLYARYPEALIVVETKPDYENLLATSYPKAHLFSTPILNLNQRAIHMYDAHDFKCDYWIPLGGLLSYMGDLPALKTPCFTADEDQALVWEAYFKPYANKLTVGIDLQLYPTTSPLYEHWSDLLLMDSCQFIALNPREDKALFNELGIHPCPYDVKGSFEERAACLTQLDAVITPFNETGILAQGLGKKTIQLTPQNDWRMLGSEKSPWFPATHVLKHTLQQDFAPQISQMVKACRKILT